MVYIPNIILGLAFLALAGCTKHTRDDGAWVQEVVQQRIAKQVKWYQGGEADQRVSDQITLWLDQPLHVEESVQIALLKNPHLQATFEEIGIAQADLVQAGLFQNPLLDGYVRFPSSLYSAINASLNLVTSFIDLFLVPLKEKTAELYFEEAKMRVADRVLTLAAEVEQTFYTLQALLCKKQAQEDFLEAARLACLLAERQQQVGNINPLFLEKKRIDLTQAELVYQQTEVEQIACLQKLSTLMGVDHPNLAIALQFPPLPEEEAPLEDLEAQALAERFDLAAAKKKVEAIASIGAAKKWWAFTDAMIGISTEKQSEGFWDTGPAFSLALPFFNHGQAERARLHAELRQAQDQLNALILETTLQVRAGLEKVIKARQIVLDYQQRILPTRENILELAQKQYNVMALGVYDLLLLKQEELRSEIDYFAAMRDYWIARSAFDLYLGGKWEAKTLP